MPDDLIYFDYNNFGPWKEGLGSVGALGGATLGFAVPEVKFISGFTLGNIGKDIGWAIDNWDNIGHNVGTLIEDINYNPNAIMDVDPLGDALGFDGGGN